MVVNFIFAIPHPRHSLIFPIHLYLQSLRKAGSTSRYVQLYQLSTASPLNRSGNDPCMVREYRVGIRVPPLQHPTICLAIILIPHMTTSC